MFTTTVAERSHLPKRKNSGHQPKLCYVGKKRCFLCAKPTDVHLFILFCFYFKPTKIIKRARELTKIDKKMYIIVSYCL